MLFYGMLHQVKAADVGAAQQDKENVHLTWEQKEDIDEWQDWTNA